MTSTVFTQGTTITSPWLNDVNTLVYNKLFPDGSGVPSNAFTREVQTATAGQTVFSLTNAYTPGTNTLNVFVNGLAVNLTTDYVETGTKVVTFTSGLTTGDEVLFYCWQINTINAASASNVSYQPSGTGALVTNVASKLGESVSVKDFGAKGDGVTDDTSAIQAALNAAIYVRIPAGTYKTTSQLVIAGSSLIGDGVFYSSPYGTSSLSGTVIKPVGLQNLAAISITGLSNNKARVGYFGIDMTSMTTGTDATDFGLSGMTKGVYIENRHDTSLEDIEVFAVPSNSAAFVFQSLTGGGLYWGKHRKLAARTKLAVGSDPTAKGFVLYGNTDSVTAQAFMDCTTYRGWYLKNVNNCQFYSCHSESAPKDSVYIEGGGQLTFVGGFFENQGTEASSRTYYQFYGVTNPKRVTLIGQSMSGNGVSGFSASSGFIRINSGGASVGDEALQTLGPLTVDSSGVVNANGNTGALLYAVTFNSTVPTTTVQAIYFSATNGFDQAAEYNSGSNNFTFKVPSAVFGGGTGTYLVEVHLKITATGAVAIPVGTTVYFGLGGAGYSGPTKIYATGTGATTIYLKGTALVRISSASSSYFNFTLYHDNAVSLIVNNSNGAVSDSWVAVSKIN